MSKMNKNHFCVHSLYVQFTFMFIYVYIHTAISAATGSHIHYYKTVLAYHVAFSFMYLPLSVQQTG